MGRFLVLGSVQRSPGKTGAFPMERSAYAKTSMIPGSFWIWVAGKSYLHDLVQAYK